jgi:long-chain acyl-CoA synthetase
VSRIQLGSAPVQAPVVLKFYEQYKIPLLQGYGSTETSLRCTGVPHGLTEEDYLKLVESNTIGTEMRYNNVSVLDQKCRELDEGVPGEICIRGPNVTRGYIDNPEQTKTAFRGGWYHSGDLGYWKEVCGRRLFFIKGRLKEIIIKGGVNISPVALEGTIAEVFPEIEQCFVIGFPHERFGEEIGLLVNMKNGNLSKLKKTIRTQGISGLLPYECPKAIIPVDYEKLPKTSTGKIQRLKLKEKYSSHLQEELKNAESHNTDTS